MLGEVLPAEAYAFLLITIRLAALIMVMPIFSDRSIPARIRVSLGLVLALVIYPTVTPLLPPMPDNVLVMAGMFLREPFHPFLIKNLECADEITLSPVNSGL